MAAPRVDALPDSGRWARSQGRSRTPRLTTTAPMREVQRARLIAAFGRGAARPQVALNLTGLRLPDVASSSQLVPAPQAALMAHDSSNKEGLSGTQAANALGRIGVEIQEGPSARASTHGDGVPLVCGVQVMPESLCRAGAWPVP